MELKQMIQEKIKSSATTRIFFIGVLVLIMLIPLKLITSVIEERDSYRAEAARSVATKWSGEQTIIGPFLSIPYEIKSISENGKILSTEIKHAHILPDILSVKATVKPEKRKKGIFEVTVYTTSVTMRGEISTQKLNSLGGSVKVATINPSFAYLVLGVSDVRGIGTDANVLWNNKTTSFASGLPSIDVVQFGINAPVSAKKKNTFEVTFTLRGSQRLLVAPFGDSTNATIEGVSVIPSFIGSFLPLKKHTTKESFSGTWEISKLNRNYPSVFVGQFQEGSTRIMPTEYFGEQAKRAIPENVVEHGESVDGYLSFGVSLEKSLDGYAKSLRLTKYGVLFTILTFLSLFITELFTRRKLHPMNYLLIGGAISLFYLIAFSLSEHIGFDSSYVVASLSTIGLLYVYLYALLKQKKVTYYMTGLLALFYFFFYMLLQLEDYALLVGAIGLFVIISFVMYLTKEIDWYSTNIDKNN